jgi:Type II CAAX prenyl endopeptidase Rce1-like
METVPSRPTQTPGYPWRIFWVLLFASVSGVAAILPYVFSIFGKILNAHPLPMPLPVLIVVQLMENTLFFGGVIALGLLLARKVGIEMPVLRRWLYSEQTHLPVGSVWVSILSGVVIAALIVLAFYSLFAPRIPDWPVGAEAALPIWKRFLACFYGAINEELLARLFSLSLLLWLARKIAREKSQHASGLVFWIANVIVAVLFSLGHVPAAKLLMQITPLVITAILCTNGAASLLFGYLFWKRGLEAAILAHFSADVILHVIGPMFLRV